MKTKLLAFAFTLIASSQVFSATVVLNKGLSPGFTVQNSEGQAVTSYLFIGSFATAPVAPADNDYSSIISSFRSFDVVADAVVVNSGVVVGSVASSWANIPATAANFNGLQMYLLVSNSSNYLNATEFALFTNSPATSFVADVNTATSSNYNVTTFASNVVVAGAGNKIDRASGADIMQMTAVVPIPETSTSLLGAIGALALLRRRRN